jgi:hypothetical protein
MIPFPAEESTTRGDEEFLARVKEKLALRKRERDAAPARAAASAPERRTSAYQRAASVLAWFEPSEMRPMPGEDEDKGGLDQLLLMSAPIVDDWGAQHWALLSDPRIAALRELRESGLTREALKANVPPDDALQRALEGYLSGTAKPVENQTLVELAAAHRVVAWLGAAGFGGLPAPLAITRRIDSLSLIQTFEHLASDDQFRGRARELEQLRSYVGVLPPDTFADAAHRVFEAILDWSEKPPLLISGPGGVGKSTLVARFILEHARAHAEDRFPFVYLDFDRPEVDPSEPLTLLIEAARQLGTEYPDAYEACDSLRSGWRDSISRSRQEIANQSASVQSGASAAGALRSATHEFSSLVTILKAGGAPVLFVLDTFEEVQWRSAAFVENIWNMLEELQGLLPRLRVVIAGRAHLEGRRTQPLALSGLDQEAATHYLRARGIKDETIARRVARQIGGSPLSLKLAAELARLEGLDSQGRLAVTTHEYFFLRLDSALVQRQLYKRILTHVHDKETRKLAYPGLVLRRITPDLIFHVLAEPCGIKLESAQQAEVLFEKLRREVSLVTVGADGSLRHRQDLRVIMLEVLRADDVEKVKAIQQKAVAYYEKRPDIAIERAEEIYHRLQLDQEPATIDARWSDGVERYLASAMEEFSGRQRGYLASRLGVDVDEETRRLADLQDWEKITQRDAEELLNHDQPQRALELIHKRSERSKASPLVGLEARALARLRRWEEALVVVKSGFERAVSDGERSEAFALALQAAEVALASNSVDNALGAFDRLAAMETSNGVRRIEATIRQLAMVKLDPALADRDPDLHARFSRLFDALTDAELRDKTGLGYWAATQFGPGDAARLARVVALCGLPRASETEVRQFAASLAVLDAGVSARLGQPSGVIAREFDISPQGLSDRGMVRVPIARSGQNGSRYRRRLAAGVLCRGFHADDGRVGEPHAKCARHISRCKRPADAACSFPSSAC